MKEKDITHYRSPFRDFIIKLTLTKLVLRLETRDLLLGKPSKLRLPPDTPRWKYGQLGCLLHNKSERSDLSGSLFPTDSFGDIHPALWQIWIWGGDVFPADITADLPSTWYSLELLSSTTFKTDLCQKGSLCAPAAINHLFMEPRELLLTYKPVFKEFLRRFGSRGTSLGITKNGKADYLGIGILGW